MNPNYIKNQARKALLYLSIDFDTRTGGDHTREAIASLKNMLAPECVCQSRVHKEWCPATIQGVAR